MSFKTKKKESTWNEYPVGAALSIGEGDKIDEISGVLKNIFPMKQAGKSTVQNGTLATENGDIKISIWGTELPKNLKGSTIKILATNKKFGDIVYKISEYDGKNGHVSEETLQIGNNADIEEVEPEGTQQDDPRQRSAAAAASSAANLAQSKANVEYEQPVRPKGGYSLLDAAESVCVQHRMVHDMVHATYAKKNLPAETLQAYVASAWILLDRAGQIIIGNHPQSPQEPRGDIGGPEKSQDPTRKAQGQESGCNPQNWAECVIPAGPLAGKKLGEVGKQVILQLEEARAEKEAVGVVPKFPAFGACVKQAAIDLDFDPSAGGGDDGLPF